MPPRRSAFAAAAFFPMHKQMLIRFIKIAKNVMHSIFWFCGMAVLILPCIMTALGEIDLFTLRRNEIFQVFLR
jgi:hypothetical protein